MEPFKTVVGLSKQERVRKGVLRKANNKKKNASLHKKKKQMSKN